MTWSQAEVEAGRSQHMHAHICTEGDGDYPEAFTGDS